MAVAAYNELAKTFTRLYHFQHANAMLGWDEMVNMPAGGGAARGSCKAELEVVMHEMLTSPATAAHFKAIQEATDTAALGSNQLANLREMRREWIKATKLPGEHVEAMSLASSKAQAVWGKCRPENDWNAFLPELKNVIDLTRKEAKMLSDGTNMSPYEALVDKYEPGMTIATLDKVFGDIRSWLPQLLQDVLKKQADLPKPQPPKGPFPVEKQRELGLDMMKNVLKFDFDHGRLDVSKHPFCGGVSEDVRLTTRYYEDTFDQGVMGIVHETGHSRYEQNRPADPWRNQPVSAARSAGVHESQSLFFEMQIGRGRPFMSQLSPLLLKYFGNAEAELFSADNLTRMYTDVHPGLIRVDADEVCYPLHVLLRYEIESALIEGKMEVEDIPQVWNTKMKEYLGQDTTGNFKDGPLQDIHWSLAYVGYFPTYTLGAVYAAQFMAAVRRDLGTDKVDSMIAEGKMDPIFDWLKTKVWNKGSFIATGEELLKEATGEPINVEYYRKHLTERYLTRQ